MANIKLSNLESHSSLSELSYEDADNITGGARQFYNALRRVGVSRARALPLAVRVYYLLRRRGFSRDEARTRSLSSPE